MQDSLLDKVAWVRPVSQPGPVRGIILRFMGLGGMDMAGEPTPQDAAWGAAGGLVVTPYTDPWAWMAPPTQAFVDELIDALIARHGLPPNVPVIATGGSMGGHGALTYALTSCHQLTACYALSAVCDLPYHYGERPDLPRTMHAAYGSYGDIRPVLEAHSPLHQAARMPDIPYLLVHGDRDDAVAQGPHSDALVAALRAQGRTVDYRTVPGMGHCGPCSPELEDAITAWVAQFLV